MKKQCIIGGRWFLAALVTMLGLAASLSPVAAGHINCGAVLGPGGTFTLDSDVGPCPDTEPDPNPQIISVVISVESATLNLNGFTVSGASIGQGLTGQHCVELIGTRATLQGPGTVRGCERGVVVLGGGQHAVRDVISEFHTNNGFLLGSNDNQLTNNTSRSNTFVGISVGNQGNKLTENTATDNGVLGFQIVGASHRLANNSATDNGDDGFQIVGDNNKIQDNFAANNANGIEVLEDATGNQLMGNVGQSNSAFDLADDNPNCDQNRWRGNAGTRNQNCIR
jgi:parallel beta-helix repeat protein